MVGMISRDDVEQLSTLSRIELSDEEAETLRKDMDNILSFVEQIQEVEYSEDASARIGVPYNVFREDGEPHDTGLYTKRLLAEAPETKDGYIKVKNIL